jgi:hypothetical protein
LVSGLTIAPDVVAETLYAAVPHRADAAPSAEEWHIPLGQLLAFTVDE